MFSLDNIIITRKQERQKIWIFCTYRGTKNGRKSPEIPGSTWVIFLDTNPKINAPNSQFHKLHTPKLNQIPHKPNNTPTFSIPFPHLTNILIPNRTIYSKSHPLSHLPQSYQIHRLSTHPTNIYPNLSFAKLPMSRSHFQPPHIPHSSTNIANKYLSQAITGGMFKLYRYNLCNQTHI